MIPARGIVIRDAQLPMGIYLIADRDDSCSQILLRRIVHGHNDTNERSPVEQGYSGAHCFEVLLARIVNFHPAFITIIIPNRDRRGLCRCAKGRQGLRLAEYGVGLLRRRGQYNPRGTFREQLQETAPRRTQACEFAPLDGAIIVNYRPENLLFVLKLAKLLGELG